MMLGKFFGVSKLNKQWREEQIQLLLKMENRRCTLARLHCSCDESFQEFRNVIGAYMDLHDSIIEAIRLSLKTPHDPQVGKTVAELESLIADKSTKSTLIM